MPLKVGSGRQTIGSNIQELLSSFKEKGMIGNATPQTPQKARQIAAAIAYKKAGKA